MITNIRLQQFRSYEDASFEFDEGVNIIVGPNASGKTNLLEAILVMARGSSYRASDIDLILFDKPWARLDSQLDGDEKRAVKLTRGDLKSQKSYLIGDKSYTRLPQQQVLPVVLFEPDHLLLLQGQPEARRQYLDDLLEQVQSSFGARRRQYKRVLSQRNALLKRQPRDIEQQLFVWNLRISELGGRIARERQQLIEKLNSSLGDLYKSIAASKTHVSVAYKSALPLNNYESKLLHKLESSLGDDIERGFTSAGPHRDDFVISFNGVPAGETASRGETRTALLALKIFELDLIEGSRGAKPLLLLDDVFSELDGKRRQALTAFLRPYQTFITTTDADIVTHQFAQNASVIPL